MTRKFHTPILLPADPAAAMEAATKQYVDAAGTTIFTGTSAPHAGIGLVGDYYVDTYNNEQGPVLYGPKQGDNSWPRAIRGAPHDTRFTWASPYTGTMGQARLSTSNPVTATVLTLSSSGTDNDEIRHIRYSWQVGDLIDIVYPDGGTWVRYRITSLIDGFSQYGVVWVAGTMSSWANGQQIAVIPFAQSAAGSGGSEVYIGTADPIGTDPTTELWYDTDASPAPAVVLPPSGLEAAKPVAPLVPMQYFATDTKRLWLWDGTVWVIMTEPYQTYVPVVSVFGSTSNIAKTINNARFKRENRTCIGMVDVTMTGAAGAAGPITLTMPTPAFINVANLNPIGVGFILDFGASHYPMTVQNVSSQFWFIRSDAPHTNWFGSDPSMTLNANDQIRFEFSYEMASGS